MNLAPAGINDITRLVEMALKFHEESGTDIRFDTVKVGNTFSSAIRDFKNYLILTLREDTSNAVVGLLAAQILVPHFSNDRVAMEWLWYVEPEYRGMCSIKLLKAYLYWAFDVMKCDHATMSTLDSDLADKLHKLYTKIGLSKQENTYIIGSGSRHSNSQPSERAGG